MKLNLYRGMQIYIKPGDVQTLILFLTGFPLIIIFLKSEPKPCGRNFTQWQNYDRVAFPRWERLLLKQGKLLLKPGKATDKAGKRYQRRKLLYNTCIINMYVILITWINPSIHVTLHGPLSALIIKFPYYNAFTVRFFFTRLNIIIIKRIEQSQLREIDRKPFKNDLDRSQIVLPNSLPV